MPIPEHITYEKKPSSPKEEESALRERVREKESAYEEAGEQPEKEAVISETVSEYAAQDPEEVIETDQYGLSEEKVAELSLDLKPEEHDAKMGELLDMLLEKGIKNTLSVVRKMEDKHIEDDFHRVLVQYLKEGHNIEGLTEKSTLYQALNMTLYQVVLPAPAAKDQQKTLPELISAMEQFYAGMLSVTKEERQGTDYFSLELAVENIKEELAFYCAVHDKDKDLFEKHITSVFPRAEIRENKDDYNIFNKDGVSVASTVQYTKEVIFPIKTYEAFDHDPLNAILNAFSKLETEGEGAAVQFVIKPARGKYKQKYKRAIQKIEKGESVDDAIDIAHSVLGELGKEVKKEIKKGVFSLIHGTASDDEAAEEGLDSSARTAVEEIQEKLDAPLLRVNIRVIASGSSQIEAERVLSNIESAFNQFENPKGHALSFNRLEGKELEQALHRFAFRLFSKKDEIPLNTKELTTLLHFPVTEFSSRELKQSEARTAPAPLEMPEDGILLGVNHHRGQQTEVRLTSKDRLRHMYVIGQTGTGKTTLLTNMITQDIQNGEGCCFIDPHGSDVEHLLSVIPKERYDDVIYFDPAYTKRPMGLNMLEFNSDYPEQKTFVVNEMLSIFSKLFNMEQVGGPMFEQYFRNAVMLVLEDPASGSTLLDVSRVLADAEYRELKLSRAKNPMVVQFWEDMAEKAGGEAALENIVPYITSKFDAFLQNDIMRPIIAQEESAFDFREIMDNQKILLVNLSKGRLGDINANLIGLILVGKILMAALSRVDSLNRDLPPFYLYIDEFQNVTTDSISTILSEARKYKLSLNVAHQFIAQLDESIKDSVFGNVGSMASYRVSSEDAEFLESRFDPVFSAKDLMELENYNYYAKMLINGTPAKPFSVKALPPIEGDAEKGNKIKEMSYQRYGRPREEIEKEIMKQYRKTKNSSKNVG